MGTIFEELIRKFNEALNENPGEHVTPRDVVHLMVDLMLAGDEAIMQQPGVVCSVYDPCCGTGGMLMLTKEHVTAEITEKGTLVQPPINPSAELHLVGQEVNPETWAVCKSDLFMKDPTGRDADRIEYGSTLSNDQHRGMGFDYLIANPPLRQGLDRDEADVRAEHERGSAGRFGAGVPRISDGQLLFLLHMLAHMKAPADGGSRMAIIMNGSPLFTGDAGSGESEIRRFVLEHDLLDTLIALPEQLFYNTGIATYVWIVTNRKPAAHRGTVQLLDASTFWVDMDRNRGDKRRRIPLDRARDILALVSERVDGATRPVPLASGMEEAVVSRVFPARLFGYRTITVERPFRLNFGASAERRRRLETERAFAALALSKKRGEAKALEEAAGRELQQQIGDMLAELPDALVKDWAEFNVMLSAGAKRHGLKLAAPIRKAILSALSERDASAEICRDADGHPEPDPELRDTESVPREVGDAPADEERVPASVRRYFAREVLPHVPDAWIDLAKRDPSDGLVGLVGYELNFNRYLYRYTPPRPLEASQADIRSLEGDIVRLLAEVTGGADE